MSMSLFEHVITFAVYVCYNELMFNIELLISNK